MLALDVLLLVMIVICVTYCWILNRRIQDLHNSRVEFARMIKEFDASIIKADRSIEEIKKSTKENNQQFEMIRAVIKNSESLTSELSMVNSMATKVSERLEVQISEARDIINALDLEGLQENIRNPNQQEIFSDYHEDNLPVNDGASYRNNYSDKEVTPRHMNKIGEALRRIVKDSTNASISTNQTGYFGSLRKINMRK